MNTTHSEATNSTDPTSKSWWIVYPKFSQAGPFTFEELKEKFEAKIIEVNTLVWCRGWKEWKRAGDCPELASLMGPSL